MDLYFTFIRENLIVEFETGDWGLKRGQFFPQQCFTYLLLVR